MNNFRALNAAAALLSLSHAAVVPSLSAREEIAQDAIRYIKCATLTTVRPDVGGWEQGMAAYYPDAATVGAPAEKVVFDMYTAVEDFFYNGKGSVYGGDSDKDTSMWVDFTVNPGVVNPPDGVYVGNVKRKTGTQTFGYNCHTDESYEYEDEEYGTCYGYVTCVQKDALKLFIKGSEDTVKGENLEKPQDIFSKLSERYDRDQRLCDPAAVDLETPGCSVKFECSDNDVNGAVLDVLVDQMINEMGGSGLYKEETTYTLPVCDPATDGCSSTEEVPHLIRSVPSVIQMKARSIPQSDARFGHEIAEVKATVECEDKNKDALCDALGTIFSLVGMVPKMGEVAGVAGVIADIGCGIEEDAE